ncbi:MAG: cytochrome b/b6 domain-containing protein [Actinomycetota bacterium]|nr:cytochrome b/b6 domain-containing protein [Actinomycetota bacterium]
MHLRNGRHGYGAVTKLLHWLTVVAVVAQVAVGWTMSADDDAAGERFEQRLERLEEEAEAQGDDEEHWEAEEERLETAWRDAEDDASTLHIALGLSIVALALARLLWRRTTPLPPWAEHLGAGERKLESWLETILLTLLLVVPATGLLLLVAGTDLLPVHVTAQIVLLAVVAMHVGLVLKHTVVRRNRHLSRML